MGVLGTSARSMRKRTKCLWVLSVAINLVAFFLLTWSVSVRCGRGESIFPSLHKPVVPFQFPFNSNRDGPQQQEGEVLTQQGGAATCPVMNNHAESDQLHQLRMWEPPHVAQPKVSRPRKVRYEFDVEKQSTLSQISQLCALSQFKFTQPWESYQFSQCEPGLWCSDQPSAISRKCTDSGCGICLERCHSTDNRKAVEIPRDDGGWCQYSAPEYQWLFEVLRERYSVFDAQDGIPFGHQCNEDGDCSSQLWCYNGNCVEKCVDTNARKNGEVNRDEHGTLSVGQSV